jgi:hypothetical protein
MLPMKSKYFETIAVLVAGGSSIKAASENVGCSLQTAYNLSATSEFRQRVSEIRTQMTTEAVGKLTSAATQAVDTLMELLTPEHEPTVRLNASKAILTHLGPITEAGEMRERINRIESQASLRIAK